MNKVAIGCGAVAVVVIFIVVVLALAVFGGAKPVEPQLQAVNQAWANVQNEFTSGAPILIPNLVETVSGAANFEKSTLVEITQARASVGQVKIDPSHAPTDAQELANFEKAQGQLSSALSRLLVVSERYPELKANANFVGLQTQLEGTENRIAVARKDFNDAVGAYNTTVKSFPTAFYAGMFNYKEKPYFNATPGSETPPKVQFNFGNSTPAPAKP